MVTSVNFTAKKRKVDEERRLFQERCTLEYFFVKNLNEKPMCLICNKIVSATKKYNVKRRYETNYFGSSYRKLHGDDRRRKVNQLQKQLNSQSLGFKTCVVTMKRY